MVISRPVCACGDCHANPTLRRTRSPIHKESGKTYDQCRVGTPNLSPYLIQGKAIVLVRNTVSQKNAYS